MGSHSRKLDDIEQLIASLEVGMRTHGASSVALASEMGHALRRCELLGLVHVDQEVEFTEKGTVFLLAAKAKQLRAEGGVV